MAEINKLLAERAKRGAESLSLYEALPEQEKFHTSLAAERLARGSNRGGKTLPAAVEVARAVTGQDPFGKWPRTDGRFFCVGKDGRHVAQVMYRKLFRAGAFKMIRDLVTKNWRAYRPWDRADLVRKEQARAAPPLIPPRFIQDIAWENKKESLPSLVILRNGWEMAFFSSMGKPPNGVDVDGVWFDEEIVDPDWYAEMSARLLDRAGRFIWSATPQAGTEELFRLHEKAEELRGTPDPKITEHVILLADNPHISEGEKQAFGEKLSEDDYEVRVGGGFALLGRKVYPEYDPRIHGTPYRQIPPHWTRYVVVDPGHQVCAVLFAAVPPKDGTEEGEGDYVYFYDELYLKGCNADVFGKELKRKSEGQRFQSFIIDHQAGRITEIASGRTIEEQYSEALARHKVESIATGTNFVWGSNDIKAGVEAFRAWLLIREDGKPRLRVIRDTMTNFEKEIKIYRKKVVKGEVLDEPNPRGRNHMMHVARYLAMYQPRWVEPPKHTLAPGGAFAALQAKKKRKKDQARAGGRAVVLGPTERH